MTFADLLELPRLDLTAGRGTASGRRTATLIVSGARTGATPDWIALAGDGTASAEWSGGYDRIAAFGTPPRGEVVGAYVIGMDPAAGSDPAELAEFDEHYNGVHVSEVFATWSYTRCTRYELRMSLGAEALPRFLAVYDYDAATAASVALRRAAAAGTPPVRAPGPRAWRERTTLWRLDAKLAGAAS